MLHHTSWVILIFVTVLYFFDVVLISLITLAIDDDDDFESIFQTKFKGALHRKVKRNSTTKISTNLLTTNYHIKTTIEMLFFFFSFEIRLKTYTSCMLYNNSETLFTVSRHIRTSTDIFKPPSWL